MTLVTYTPNRTLNAGNFHRALNPYLYDTECPSCKSDWTPRIDGHETDDALHFSIDLPGVKKDDVAITVKDDVLTISGSRPERKDKEKYFRIERGAGKFERQFTLLTKIDADKISASLQDGVLELVLPKAEEVKPREIEIK